MRRVPTALWILLPLLLAGLYALLYGLFAAEPTLETVVPAEAVFTQRFRDKSALDRTWPRSMRGKGRPSEAFAESRNLAGLVGVDPMRPFHFVLLENRNRADPSMAIFPVGDADLMRARFEDPSFFLARGHVRHPQHLGIRGDWAAVAGELDAIQHLGEGGITAEDLGETMAIAIDVPRMVDHALAVPWMPLWEGVLRGLGFKPKPNSEGLVEYEAGRVVRVQHAWKTARFWTWLEERRVRIELESADTRLLEQLQAVRESTAYAHALPTAPTNAQAWILIPNARARDALTRTLYLLGAQVPKAFDDPGEGGLLVWAAPNPGKGWTWTLGAVGEGTFLDRIAAALPTKGEGIAEDGWSLLRANLRDTRPVPEARVLRASRDGHEILLVGATAQDALARFTAHRAGAGATRDEPATADGAWRPLGTFVLRGFRAEALFGGALQEGGLFAALAGGDIEGTISTDGRRLRLDAKATGP